MAPMIHSDPLITKSKLQGNNETSRDEWPEMDVGGCPGKRIRKCKGRVHYSNWLRISEGQQGYTKQSTGPFWCGVLSNWPQRSQAQEAGPGRPLAGSPEFTKTSRKPSPGSKQRRPRRPDKLKAPISQIGGSEIKAAWRHSSFRETEGIVRSVHFYTPLMRNVANTK